VVPVDEPLEAPLEEVSVPAEPAAPPLGAEEVLDGAVVVVLVGAEVVVVASAVAGAAEADVGTGA
jgi:hypothetical protein